MYFIGEADCNSNAQTVSVLSRVATLPNVLIRKDGNKLTVEYTPKDTETSREEEITVAKLTDIINSVEKHGISIIG